MKKIVLLLLAANLIFLLWLYGDYKRMPADSLEESAENVAIEEMITLSELGVEVHGDTELEQSISEEKPVQPASAEVAESFTNPSDLASVIGIDAELKEKVEASVQDAVSFVAEVIDDIESPQEAQPHCYTLGPFLVEDEAGSAVNRLQAQNIVVTLSNAERHESGGYWVFIPSDSLRSARKQIDQLKELGVSDVVLSTVAGVRHWVSLGVYSTKERAQRRQVALGNLGFYTRMEERVLKNPEYWIDIKLGPEQETSLIESVADESWPVVQEAFCRETGNLSSVE